MKILLFAAGSQGDLQPSLRLGHGLQRAGFEVTLAAPQNFAALSRDYGLPFIPLPGDVQAIMAGDTGRDFMAHSGTNPLRGIVAMRRMLRPIALHLAEALLAACDGADALISLAVFAPLAKTVAELRAIPLLLVEPTPLLPAGAFPAPGWPIQRDWGSLPNRLSGVAMLRVIWFWYQPFVNAFRKHHGLPPLAGGAFRRILQSTPLLGAYSPTVIPRPAEWPADAHVSGYLFDQRQAAWSPPPALAAFLQAGPPPVYVGFGSMTGQDPRRVAAIVLEALARSGQRGILATGWGGLEALQAPEQVFVIEGAPHGWLFPRLQAVVHHGGAGTTAEGLRAGRPSVIVPFIVDQQFWGERVQALGAGPPPIAAKKLSAAGLAAAIRTAATDTDMQQRAAAVGRAIRAEQGVDNAVALVRRYLGDAS